MSSSAWNSQHVPAPLRGPASLVYTVVVLTADRDLTYLAAATAFYTFA